jgi:hypothetical protein
VFNPEITESYKKSLQVTLENLPPAIRDLIPDDNLDYYKKTNEMHCDISSPGGSKFIEIENIFKVFDVAGVKIAKMIEKREDDRESLLVAGADQTAFLPATRGNNDPEGLPEALYYMVENIKGKIGIIQLKDLSLDTQIIIRREKSVKDEEGLEKVPCSLSVIKESIEDMPDTDFATVIIGRKNSKEGKNELWSIHPGIPVRPAQSDFIKGSEELPGPEEGVLQKIMTIKVKDLLDSGQMKGEDYVKIIVGNQSEILSQYDIR